MTIDERIQETLNILNSLYEYTNLDILNITWEYLPDGVMFINYAGVPCDELDDELGRSDDNKQVSKQLACELLLSQIRYLQHLGGYYV